MRKYAVAAVLAIGASGYGQMFDDITLRMMSPGGTAGRAPNQMFDDITLRMMSPRWSTVLVGANSNFGHAGTHVIRSHHEWQQAWPFVSPGHRHGMQVPRLIDWRREQLILISLGNLGVQGYGLYVENVRRTSQFQFDVHYVITRPSFQAGISYSNFNYGYGTSPYVAIRVPRSYGLPSFYSRYYSPSSYVISSGYGYNRGHGHGQVWMVGAGGVLIPYVPPGQQQHTGGGHGQHTGGGHGQHTGGGHGQHTGGGHGHSGGH